MMKNIGYLLIGLGFLVGSYFTMLDKSNVEWGAFTIFLILGFVGVAIVQVGNKKAAKSEDTMSSNIAIIESSLANLVDKVSQLNADKHSINTYDMRHKIDEMLIEDLNNFADARQTIGHKYGLASYAEVMRNFAGGERYLNRVWSASADGYIDEVNEYMEKAQVQFIEARQKLQELNSA